MALRVDAAGDGETDEVHLRGGGEHERADFDRAHAAFEVKFGGEGYAGELFLRNLGEEGARVEIDGVAARRLHDGDAFGGDVVAEIGGGGDAVAEVVLVEGLLEADGDGFEVASGEAAVGGIPFRQDEQVFFLLGELVVVGTEEAADVGHAVFLGGHGAAVTVAEHFLGDLFGGFVGVAGLAQLDKPGIFGEAAGVEVERDAVAAADGADGSDVFHGDGLAAPGVICNRQHH